MDTTRLLTHAWAYPLLEVVHIVGIAGLFGSLLVLELRLWGRGSELPAAPLARLALTVTWTGFVLVLASGGLMFSTQWQDLLANTAFRAKLVLLALAAVNAVAFHRRGGVACGDGSMRALGLLSLLLWVGVIICGRWIAYA